MFRFRRDHHHHHQGTKTKLIPHKIKLATSMQSGHGVRESDGLTVDKSLPNNFISLLNPDIQYLGSSLHT
jgi:hypothetical protein